MKTYDHRSATVPHFVALLGVLHEAATRGLGLLADEPAPRRFPGLARPPSGRAGKPQRSFFQALEKTACPVSKPWKTAAGARA